MRSKIDAEADGGTVPCPLYVRKLAVGNEGVIDVAAENNDGL
jgi:hypothetical protein